MNKLILTAAVAAVPFPGVAQRPAAPSAKQTPVRVIFETDMGNDVDDALALDMLFKYMDRGLVELLGISTNKSTPGSAEYIDALTTWYGHPGIPLGKVAGHAAFCDDANNYAAAALKTTDASGQQAFPQSHASDGFIVPSVELYRKVLAQQPDSSVTVISVGFSTNLAQLLESGPDAFSPLGGRDLVGRKVKLLVNMAGNMVNPNHVEYNVERDVTAARKVYADWPSPIVTSPWELGNYICYPASSIEKDFTWTALHPVVEGYKAYLPMPYDRPTWDLTSVLYAVEGTGPYFTIRGPGRIVLDERGITTWHPDGEGRHYVLEADQDRKDAILRRFLEIIPLPPATRQK